MNLDILLPVSVEPIYHVYIIWLHLLKNRWRTVKEMSNFMYNECLIGSFIFTLCTCSSLLDIDTLHVLLIYTLPLKCIIIFSVLFCFLGQSQPLPKSRYNKHIFPCVINFTGLQLISYLKHLYFCSH